MGMIVTTLLGKLKERSTWAGLATLTAAVGWKLSPEEWGSIASAVIAAISLYEVFRREKK
jgi:hypothetical protein